MHQPVYVNQGIGTPVDMSAAFMQFETSAWSGHAAAAELAGDMKYSGGVLDNAVDVAIYCWLTSKATAHAKIW